ncbi:hypothetical protein [Cupriavidus basilensis]|uniref:hypothetical protein n=1 Tax=Cupriavidus basilensis TaxID=68895 RepID=UPI0020A6D921|nr:hypothetical protein [Cupriavidus basilensis]MCP3017476.1 hypothetical protein [Cupriavidus basilensis]
MNDLHSEKALRKLGNWLRSQDTGVSSETMAAIFLGATKGNFDAPHDNSDFGRCCRLVKKVPEIRAVFPRIAKKVPAFAGILREWDELAMLFEHGAARPLYSRIKALRAEGTK